MRWTVKLDGGPRRVNHAAAIIDDLIYSFGGYCTDAEYQFYTTIIDVYVLNVQTLRWLSVPNRKDQNGVPLKYPEIPFQRYGHTVVAYEDNIYLWGGRNDEASCNNLYQFNTKSLSWSRPNCTGSIPGARDGHSACVVGSKMYIFGGFEDDIDQFSCDVHCLNFITMEWQFIFTCGDAPSYRDFHSSIYLNNKMYIFGGRGDKHSPLHSQEEIYCPEIVYLDLLTKTWHRPKTIGKVPVGRRSSSMFVYNELIYIFGGYNGIMNQHFNDLYSFNPKISQWNLVKPRGKPPSARRRQVCIVCDNKMFLFGGTSPSLLVNPTDVDASSALYDNNDTHILDFSPTLKTLSILTVLKYRLDQSLLPEEIRCDIRSITTPNNISRPINQNG